MKTLYLHIGTTKTGTTSIQKFCLLNQAVLQEKNFCFPDSIYRYENKKDATFKYKGIHRNGHFLVGSVWDENGKHNIPEEDRLFSEGMANVAKLFTAYDNVILSDEGIWYMSSYGKRDLWDRLSAEAKAHDYQIKIIVYLRRQDDFFISNWNQAIKENHMTASIEEAMEDTLLHRILRYDYGTKLDLIAQVFGRDHIIVRRFDRQEFYQGSIYADFLYCLGLELTDGFLPLESSTNNTSLEGNSLEIMRVLNTVSALSPQERLTYLEDLRAINEASGYQCSMLSTEERQSFMSHFEEGNQHVAEEYIRDGKPLFNVQTAAVPKWKAENPYMHEELIRCFAMNNHRLCEKIDAQNAKIEALTMHDKALEQKNAALETKLQYTKNQLKHPVRTIGTKMINKVKKS